MPRTACRGPHADDVVSGTGTGCTRSQRGVRLVPRGRRRCPRQALSRSAVSAPRWPRGRVGALGHRRGGLVVRQLFQRDGVPRTVAAQQCACRVAKARSSTDTRRGPPRRRSGRESLSGATCACPPPAPHRTARAARTAATRRGVDVSVPRARASGSIRSHRYRTFSV